jgi:predicted AlkP superfamily phosphohydrolase/phosphomutase
MAQRVIILGLDGASWRVLTPAIQQGHMPFLESLVQTGCSGVLTSTVPPVTPAAWGSFQTGKNPGKTGVYDFERWNCKTHTSEYVSSQSLGMTLWDYLGRAGKRIAVINLPMTYPARPVPGVLITGLLTPNLKSQFIYPPAWREDLLKHVPDYHIFNLKNASRTASPHHVHRLVRRLQEIMESRARAAAFVFQREHADVAMVHFQATDVLQHALWHALCPDHPQYDPSVCEYLLSAFYGFLDARLRYVWEAFGKGGSAPLLTLVVSDHGFQPHYKRVRLGTWLAQKGYLSIQPERGPVSWVRVRLRRLDAPVVLTFLERTSVGRKLDRFRRQPTFRIDIDSSRAFSFGRGGYGYLFFLEDNPAARQATERQIRQELMELIDPETGTPVVQEICPRDSLYVGPRLEEMPDWVLRPAEGYSFTGNYEPGVRGLFSRIRPGRDFHAGMHHPEGVIIAAGQGVRCGRVEGARLWDVAPTILACLGLPVPDDMDGVVLQNLFTEPLAVQTAEVEASPPSVDVSHTTTYSPSDVHDIEQRLRDLGYLE